MAHTRRRTVEELDRVASGAARAQTSRRLHRMASGGGERALQRRFRSSRHRLGREQMRGGERH